MSTIKFKLITKLHFTTSTVKKFDVDQVIDPSVVDCFKILVNMELRASDEPEGTWHRLKMAMIEEAKKTIGYKRIRADWV